MSYIELCQRCGDIEINRTRYTNKEVRELLQSGLYDFDVLKTNVCGGCIDSPTYWEE